MATEFTDFNAKLLVLDVLCCTRRVLPRYAGEPPEGYSATLVDEAARAHYRDLVIPEELLAGVTEVVVDGGLSIYQDIAPYWDGEDDLFDVADWSQVAALPALEVVSSTSPLPEGGRRALRERGIVVDDHADTAFASIGRRRTIAGTQVRVWMERGYDAEVDELIAAFDAAPADDVLAGAPVRFGVGRFALVRERDDLALVAVNYRHPGRWDRNLSLCLRTTRAQREFGADPGPELSDLIDVHPGAVRARRVVLTRAEPAPGHSGWSMRVPGSEGEPQRRPLVDLRLIRPGALRALSLPVGSTVVLDVDDVVEVS